MSAKNKISVGVYEIDLNRFEEVDFKAVVNELISRVNQNGNSFIKENLKKNKIGDHQILLFSGSKKYPPTWRGFISDLLQNDSSVKKCQNLIYSYVCFVGNDEHIFAVAGGYGSQAIAGYTTSHFGLNIIVRLFQRNSKVIQGIQDRGLTGNVLGQTKFYRGDQKISDEDQFGKIFKEIKAQLSEKVLVKSFGFNKADLGKKVSRCLAKSSFQIYKAINFDTLIILIDRFIKILAEPENFPLNKVTLLTKRKDRELLKQLEEILADKLYQDCKSGKSPDIDFCHADFESFLSASSHQLPITKDHVLDFDGTFSDLLFELKKDDSYFDEGVEDFKHSVLYRKIYSLDSDGNELTNGSVLSHVNGEFTLEDKSYFLVDGEWYRIQSSFIRDLNKECKEIMEEVWEENLIQDEYDIGKRESIFNHKFVGRDGFFVFDTITPDNIEFCDVLSIDDKLIHLIHVKKGFDNSIRELASQIHISAKTLRDDVRAGFEYIDEVEIQSKKGLNSVKADLQAIAKQQFPKDGLSSLFKGKRFQDIVFCFAFVDEANTVRSLRDDVSSFHSNIAKFSLLELRHEIISMGFGFKVIQIKKAPK